MQSSNTPGKLVLPFAAAGGKNSIPTDSQIGIVAGKASLTDGFPPLTRTPLSAGGVPPSGLDMNGILYEMSAVIRWANAGGGYAYDATFATDTNVNGYPIGARIMRSDGKGYWFNTVENNTTDPESAGAAAAGWVPDYQNGVTAVTMTSANVTLTPLQYGKPLIVISGALTANLNLIFPAIAGEWTVVNNCTGNFTVTCKTATGSGVSVDVGYARQIYGDGTNIASAQNAADMLRLDLISSAAGKGANLSAYGDPVAPAYLKTVSDIINGERVSVMRFIPTTKHAGIYAGTNNDDLAAYFTDAFNGVASAGRGRVELPAGTFHTSNVTAPAGMKSMRGVGDATSIIAVGSIAAFTPLLNFASQSGIDIGDFKLTVDKTTYAQNHAIQISTCSLGNVSNIHMPQAGYIGIYAPGCSDINFQNIFMEAIGSRGFYADTSPTRLALDNVKIYEKGTAHSIQIIGGNQHKITRCFTNKAPAGNFGINLWQCTDSLIALNQCIVDNVEGINIQDSQKVNIQDNEIFALAGHHDFGISIYAQNADVTHCLLSGNRIYFTGKSGIAIAASPSFNARLNHVVGNLIVSPNQLGEAQGAGVLLYGSAKCSENTVQANRCTAEDNNMKYGVNEWNDGNGAPTYNHIIDNPVVTAPGLVAQANILGTTSQVWELAKNAFTPTVTALSGSITTASGTLNYQRRGKFMTVDMTVTITTNGTGAGAVNVTLPFSCANGVLNGRENNVSGKQLCAVVSGANAIIRNYDNTYPGANGATMQLSGVLELS